MEEVEQTIKTYDRIASSYCKWTRQPKFLEWEENYIQKLLFFISKSNPLVLDAGCGDGRHCLLIDKSGGRAVGIDLSDSMLEESRTLYPDGNFRKMDMQEMSFDDDFFEGIWSSGSIYHVPKSHIDNLIREFGRVLKPEGVVAVNFKLGEGEGMDSSPKSYSGAPRYFAYYTEKEMGSLFRSRGFEELESRKYPEEVFGDSILQMWFRLRMC